jgi:hypothetical protein
MHSSTGGRWAVVAETWSGAGREEARIGQDHYGASRRAAQRVPNQWAQLEMMVRVWYSTTNLVCVQIVSSVWSASTRCLVGLVWLVPARLLSHVFPASTWGLRRPANLGRNGWGTVTFVRSEPVSVTYASLAVSRPFPAMHFQFTWWTAPPGFEGGRDRLHHASRRVQPRNKNLPHLPQSNQHLATIETFCYNFYRSDWILAKTSNVCHSFTLHDPLNF